MGSRSTNLIQLVQRKDLQLGFALGLAGLALSWGVNLVLPGRLLGNPIPLMLAISSLGRAIGQTFAYFNWQDPALHLGFVALLAIASGLVGMRAETDHYAKPVFAARVGRIAMGLNVLAAASDEVDALTVGLFYAGAGFLSVIAAGWIAEWSVRIVGSMLSTPPTR